MATFTSTLPDDLLLLLSEKAHDLALPKNKLIENALHLYLEHLEKAEYIKSYRRAATDKDVLTIAEEGVADYLRQLEQEEMWYTDLALQQKEVSRSNSGQ